MNKNLENICTHFDILWRLIHLREKRLRFFFDMNSEENGDDGKIKRHNSSL